MNEDELREIEEHRKAYHEREFPWPYVDRLLTSLRECQEERERLRGALGRIERCPYPDYDPGDEVGHKPLEVCHDGMRDIARQAPHPQETKG